MATRLLTIEPRRDWRRNALCAEVVPDVFYPAQGTSPRDAKRLCQGCAVRADCLAWALEQNERDGVWGGLSARQRRGMRGKRGARAGT